MEKSQREKKPIINGGSNETSSRATSSTPARATPVPASSAASYSQKESTLAPPQRANSAQTNAAPASTANSRAMVPSATATTGSALAKGHTMPSASAAAANYYSHASNGSSYTYEPGVEADGQSDTSDEDNGDVHEVPVANHYRAPATTVIRAAGVRSAAPATRAPQQQQRSAAAAQQRTTPLRATANQAFESSYAAMHRVDPNGIIYTTGAAPNADAYAHSQSCAPHQLTNLTILSAHPHLNGCSCNRVSISLSSHPNLNGCSYNRVSRLNSCNSPHALTAASLKTGVASRAASAGGGSGFVRDTTSDAGGRRDESALRQAYSNSALSVSASASSKSALGYARAATGVGPQSGAATRAGAGDVAVDFRTAAMRRAHSVDNLRASASSTAAAASRPSVKVNTYVLV